MEQNIRIIHYVSEDPNSSREGVFFTEDMEMNATDAIPHGFKLYSDVTVDMFVPSGFPIEINLDKTF